MESFAINLKKAREKEGLTQRELATELNVSINTYVTWEARGKNKRVPTMKVIAKIADILNISLDELVGR